MWKSLWKTWTIDKPALLGDWLWDVFVVQLAAFLDRLTVRQVIAFLPVIILILAYCHRIPLPPELMLVGDVLAYIDVFSALFLLGILSRATTIVFVMKQAAGRAARFLAQVRRLDFRHRRARGCGIRKQAPARSKTDDEPAIVVGMAWA